jgi:Zn-dependent peptidase ImmA (M78 family)
MRSPSLVAASIIEELNIKSVKDLQLLDQIAFERGAIVKRSPLATAEARLVVGRPYSVITVSTTIPDVRRERFSIAHELGHLELHRQERVFSCDSESINDWSSKASIGNLEQNANEFAASLLLPEKLFSPLCLEAEPSLDTVRLLVEQFNVSLTAATIRYVQFCYDPVAVVFTQRRQIRWFRRNEAFEDYGFFVNVNSMVEDSTITARFFNSESLPRSAQLVKASNWMMPGGFKDIYLREQCIAMPSYDAVLSLLWVENEWADEEDD